MKKTIEKIFPRHNSPHMVGDGFRVYNLIPGVGITQRRISPFLMLDFNPEYDFGPSEQPRGVDVHPHKGFETVTIAYQGSVAHYDSAGNSGIIRPGDVQWMTAGAGILHKEFHEEEFSRKGGPFEMVQLWINLPRKDKSEPAHYQALTAGEMGKVTLPGDSGTVNVIAGTFQGTKGPAATYTPVNLFDIKLKKGGTTEFSVPASHNTAMLVIHGSVEVNGETAGEHRFVLFGNEGTAIQLKANEDSVLLLMSGEPIEEPIASYGPFVLNTQEEILDAIRDFQAGKYGVLE
jgi:redox-sensitive bicupin YhaK (pirin superfamily)